MNFLSLEPFVPSGRDFDGSKQLFEELGFTISWDAGDYVGFERESCRFILQKYDNTEFAENFMVNVRVDDIDAFYKGLMDKGLSARFGVRIGQPTQQPYGKEVNIIDLAGVCWHFVE